MKKIIFFSIAILILSFSSLSFGATYVGIGIRYSDLNGGDFTMSTMRYLGEAKVDIGSSLRWFGSIGILYYYLRESQGYMNGFFYKYNVDSPIYISSGLKYRILSEKDFPFALDLIGEGNITKINWNLYIEETDETLQTLEELSSLILRFKLSKKIGYGNPFIDAGFGNQVSTVNSTSISSGLFQIKIGVDAETPDDVLLYSFVELSNGLMSWFTGLENTSASYSWAIGILKKF